MSSSLVEVSYEQASDLVGASTVLESLDLGATSVALLQHPQRGKLLVTCGVDGRACVLVV